MNKRGGIAIFEVSNLIIAIIAFSFLVGLSIESVSSYEIENGIITGQPNSGTYPTYLSAVEAGDTAKINLDKSKNKGPGDQLGSGTSAVSAAGGISTPLGNLGSTGSLLADSLIGSLSWAIGVAGAVYMLAGMFGLEGSQSKALAVATFAGTMG